MLQNIENYINSCGIYIYEGSDDEETDTDIII